MRKLIFINYVGILLLIACGFTLLFVSIILSWPIFVIGVWFTLTKKSLRAKPVEEPKIESTA